MNTTTTPSSTPRGQAQREALEQSERKATEQQPDNFRDKANADKKVEVGPDMTDAPIKHIDPAESPGSSR